MPAHICRMLDRLFGRLTPVCDKNRRVLRRARRTGAFSSRRSTQTPIAWNSGMDRLAPFVARFVHRDYSIR